jgi:hypothetical protein
VVTNSLNVFFGKNKIATAILNSHTFCLMATHPMPDCGLMEFHVSCGFVFVEIYKNDRNR